jgi:hypothetical protein
MLARRNICLAAILALTAASPASAQVNINVNVGRPQLPPFFNIGTVSGYRPVPPVFRPPMIGVVKPRPPVWGVLPVTTLRPTIYPAVYLNRFTPGFQTILVGTVPYYYYPALPPGATFVTVGGAGYYQAGGIWYQPYAMAGGNVFLVVPPPL